MDKYEAGVSFRLKSETYEKLKEVAKNCQTSNGSIIRQALIKFLKEYK